MTRDLNATSEEGQGLTRPTPRRTPRQLAATDTAITSIVHSAFNDMSAFATNSFMNTGFIGYNGHALQASGAMAFFRHKAIWHRLLREFHTPTHTPALCGTQGGGRPPHLVDGTTRGRSGGCRGAMPPSVEPPVP